MIDRTIGHYKIVAELGRGASGTVYKAVDVTLDRAVAIKVLNPDVADPAAIQRFRAEATILAKLNHPAVATIYELFRSESELVMVMEFVRGETLDALSNRVGPLPPARAAWLIERILQALDHAHRAGIVHGDMKPANVMVTDETSVKIMDFGIARVRGARHDGDRGAMMGTPAYMPPEQVLGRETDCRSDLYAVGVIFYRLLTTALPFEAESAVDVLRRQIRDRPTPLRFHREDLPGWCDTILQRALAKSPAGRFQTAEEFGDALARVSGVPATTPLARDVALAWSAEVTPPAQGVGTDTMILAGAAASAGERSASVTHGRRPFRYVAAALLGCVATMVVVASGARRDVLNQIGTPAPTTEAKQEPAVELKQVPAAETTMPAASRPADVAPNAVAPHSKVRNRPAPLVFDAKALVGAGREQRVSDAKLVLADDTVSVMTDRDPERALYSVPSETVTSISYSHSSDPMWSSPSGPTPVTRIERGALAAFGIVADHDWISLRTKSTTRFIVLRVRDGEVTRILSALQQRTGVTPQRLTEPRQTRMSGRPVL
jgi:tRNA A-37 threonylcarbamoyl transferase component Bud32